MTLGGLAASLAAAASVGTPPCPGQSLTGSFSVVRGSAGAGNIVYALRLRNRSRAACFVSGIPALTLLDAHGRAQATHARAATPGRLTAVLVRLAPDRSAKLTARFSPDVTGPGEPVGPTCEPKSYKLRVVPNGGGAVVVPIEPPTPICEHGALALSAFGAG